jgi:ubiquitin C-terminal hydrolase
MNAIMQCFANMTVIRNFYLAQEYAAYKSINTLSHSFDFSNSMFLFYKTVWTEKKKVVSIDKLRTHIMKKFEPVDQHDAHEFLLYLVQNLQEEGTPVEGHNFDGSVGGKSQEQVLEEYRASHPSIIDDIFTGMEKTLITCPKGCQSVTFNPFMTLTLHCTDSLHNSIHDILKPVPIQYSPQ